jgi:nucleotide-binding universal stress UspA family protein
MGEEEQTYNKNILIAVDRSENARRAVAYVGQMLGGIKGFRVTVLHIVPEPEEDYFPGDSERQEWLQRYQLRTETLLAECRQMLIKAGFDPENVSTQSTLRFCPSMAECILTERERMEYSTLVVGRRGISRSEEFIFGSISHRVVRHARNCTVWVVE